MRSTSILIAVVLTVASGCAFAQGTPPVWRAATGTQPPTVVQPWIEKIEPREAIRGSLVKITFSQPLTDFRNTGVCLKKIGKKPEGCDVMVDGGTVKFEGKTASFIVPQDTRLGRYQISMLQEKGINSEKPVEVVAPTGPDGDFVVVTKDAITLLSVNPRVVYPDGNKDFALTIIGEGFSPYAEDNTLFVEGRGPIFETCPAKSTEKSSHPTYPCIGQKVSPDGRRITFSGIPFDALKGTEKVTVRVGERKSDDDRSVTIAQMAESKVRCWAGGITACVSVFFIILLVVGKPSEKQGPDGKTYTLVQLLFLEKETNTYSLSKGQFYLWTAVILLGYVYLMLSRILVQGVYEFMDIPSHVSGIFFISAITSGAAVGIDRKNGGKGAGEIGMCFADFFTVGGVVAPERVQFFVWTLVGVGAFGLLTVLQDPATIATLPNVPEQFLYLMGISSFGYVGGKWARNPGPKIARVQASIGSEAQGKFGLTFDIQGSCLSPNATFKIEGKDVSPRSLGREERADAWTKILVPGDTSEFANGLRLEVPATDTDQAWLTGEHPLALTNPDGQKAVCSFTRPKEVTAESTSKHDTHQQA